MTILSKSMIVESLNITEQAVRVVVLLVQIIIPLAVAVIGVTVFLRRRNR